MELYVDGQRNSLFSNEIVSVSPHFGTEIKFKNLIDFRFGIGDISSEIDFNNVKYIKVQPNIGVGFHFENIRIDYALANMLELSSEKYSNLFSLRYNLK